MGIVLLTTPGPKFILCAKKATYPQQKNTKVKQDHVFNIHLNTFSTTKLHKTLLNPAINYLLSTLSTPLLQQSIK